MPRNKQSGLSLIELIVVVLVIGVLASMAMVTSSRYARKNDVRQAALVVAGALKMARDLAVHEGSTYLVIFHGETNCADGRDPILDVVKDVDGTMSASAPDKTRPISLPDTVGCEITSYDPDTGPFPDLTLPVDDLMHLATLQIPVLPAVAEGADEDDIFCDDEDDGCFLSSTTPFSSRILDGATFAVESSTGSPVVAFTPRGSPVHPDSPNQWGSGAGGYYLTNGSDTVVGVILYASGHVRVRTYHPETRRWH